MASTEGSRPVHILLVEDNPADVRLTEIALEEANLQNRMSVVNNGEEALAFLRREAPYTAELSPDVILLDLNLPRKNGYEVLSEMQQDPALAEIPTIVLTGSLYEQEALHKRGFDTSLYLVKPLDFTCLHSALRRFKGLDPLLAGNESEFLG